MVTAAQVAGPTNALRRGAWVAEHDGDASPPEPGSPDPAATSEPASASEAATSSEAATFDAALERARRGEAEGLTVLFRAWHPRLLRYLRGRDHSLADDVAGEVWMAVAQRIGSFEGGHSAFSAWIFTIARQRLADHHRTRARRRTVPVADVPESQFGRSGEDQVIERLSAQDAVDEVVRRLNSDQAEVVLLRTLGGLSVGGVAAVMDRPESWVRVTHHRALRRLSGQTISENL